MSNFLHTILWIAFTVAVYLVARKLYLWRKSHLLLPVLSSTVFIIAFLLLSNIPYETYMIGGNWISNLLGPAVVALAYPLYEQRETLKKLATPILIGTSFGSFVGVFTGVFFANILGFDELIIYALSPKSVTTPVAMAITESAGGPTPLAAVFVMIAGVGGVLVSPIVFKLFRINGTIGRGVGIGSASHAVGTASAMENSQLEGSISTVSMIVSAVIVSIITPFILAIWF